MTRPTSVKPDNFFLLLFRALRQRRVPIALRLASHSLILVALALLIYAWVMGMQFRQAMQQQADALGQSLITQTAASATELLVSNDILSLNVLLNNLVKNPLVAHAAIYSIDQRILAEAGSRPKQSLLGATEGLYSTPITFQEVIAGHLRISLDMQQFQQPMMISLQSMGLISLILLILALYFSLRLGRQISTPLLQLRVWLRDPDNPAPGAELQNELGDLARDLEERLVPEKPPAPEPEEAPLPQNFDDILLEDDEADLRSRKVEASAFEEDDIPLGDALLDETKPVEFTSIDEDPLDQDAFDENGAEAGDQPAAPAAAREPQHSAVLAIQLGAQEQLRRLPRSRLVDLLQRYRDCLEQAARQYKGSLHTLSDGGSLILFHSRDNRADYLTNALCCGELMRALGHALQIEVADSGITLQLQLGLSLGEDLSEQTQADLLLNETVQNALALNQHSRNLLLVEAASPTTRWSASAPVSAPSPVRKEPAASSVCWSRIRRCSSANWRACTTAPARDHPDHPPAAGPGGGTGPWQPGDPATPAAGRHARRLPAGLRRSRLQARHRLSRCLRPSRLQPFAIVRRDPRRARRPRLPAAA